MGTTHKGLSITVKNEGTDREKILITCFSCKAHLPEVLSETYGPSSVTVRAHKEEPEPETNGKLGGMEWWVSKTGVPKRIWESLGCEAWGNGVRFLFEGEGAYKTRRPPKEFAWAPKGASAPPLWPMPGWEMPEHITLTAGESDCGTAHAAGLPYAFAVTRGEGSSLDNMQFQALVGRGVKEVTLVGDADDRGEVFTIHHTRGAVDAGLIVNITDLRMVLDPFSGMKDLNDVWRAAENKKEFLEVVGRATYRYEDKDPGWDPEEILSIAEEELEWIMPDLITPWDKILISGPQKSFKTWFMLDLVRSLTTLAPFLGKEEWRPSRSFMVGIVEEEGSPQHFARRLRSMGKVQNLRVLFKRGIRFTEPDSISRLISWCRKHKIEVLFMDPMQRMVPGVDENSANESGIVWDEVFRIQQQIPGIVVIIIHHANKSDEGLSWSSIRGSSRHGGEVDLGIFLKKHPTDRNALRMAMDGRDVMTELGPGEAFDLDFTKTEETFTLKVRPEITVTVRPKQQETKDVNRHKILEAMQGGHDTRTQIMKATGLSDATVREHLKLIVEEGVGTEVKGQPGRPNRYKLANTDEH